ncbi:MAG: hypothetical protein AABX96_03975 [Nanoarchaeota archaeon]
MINRTSKSKLENLSSQSTVKWMDFIPVYEVYSYAKDRLVDNPQVRNWVYGAALLTSHTVYLAVTLTPFFNLVSK